MKNLNNRFFSTLMALLITATAMAVPAKRVRTTITLTDGTTREVVLQGDETMHFYADAEGRTYRAVGEDLYEEVSAAALATTWSNKVKARNTARSARRSTQKRATDTFKGSKKGLVILVNFKDKSMTFTRDRFDQQFNKEGYNQDHMAGSVHDYFKTSSYGLFDLTFDVVGPYTLSQNMSYYGKDVDEEGNDQYPGTMITEAVNKANADGVDFTQYDWDGDGYVDQVFVIYAGYGQAQGAASNTIWPHEWDLESAKEYGNGGNGPIKVDGVTVNTYACSNELRGTSGTSIDGIGTACHEFSHCMGLPDLYDTSGKTSNFGMDIWDVMDYGSYNGYEGNGESPWTYTSYERWVSGWLTPTELKEGCNIQDMKPLYDTPEAYVIYNEKNKNEYYLLENRQLKGFDSEGYGHGMLVLHVDYDQTAWEENTVNNTSSRQRLTIIPADGSQKSVKDGVSYVAGDPFPGTKNKTALTNTTSPAATLYNANSDGKKYMNKPIEDITENTSAGTISFKFNGGVAVEVPVMGEVTDLSESGFLAQWSKVAEALSYDVELTARDTTATDPAECLLLDEDFSGFNNKQSQDGTTDLNGKLDSYTNVTGWSGSKVFTSPSNKAKIGSSNTAGSLSTPSLEAPESGSVTVAVTMEKYGNDTPSVTVKAGGITMGTFTLGAEETYVCTAEVSNAFKVSLEASGGKKRYYISELKVYDGTFQASDLESPSKAPRQASAVTTYRTTDNHYLFSDLSAAYTYKVRVRSVAAEGTSAWSEPVNVQLKPATAIEEQSYGANPEAPLYDLQGRRLKEAKGLYIQNGQLHVAE